jgi:hypothetical protein
MPDRRGLRAQSVPLDRGRVGEREAETHGGLHSRTIGYGSGTSTHSAGAFALLLAVQCDLAACSLSG